MNKTKRGYETPTSELLVVRFEQNIMSGFNTLNHSEYFVSGVDDDYEEL